MQNMQDRISHRLMSEYLFDISPELHKTCIEAVEPLLDNEHHIQEVFNYVLFKQNGVFNTENAHLYLAVIYRIYSPMHLYSKDQKLKAGIRGRIASAFNYKNPEMINYFADTVLPHFKNPRWAAQVNELAFEIVENIKSELLDLE